MSRWWQELPFDHTAASTLGVDDGTNDDYGVAQEFSVLVSSWREVSGACYATVDPMHKLKEPLQIVCISTDGMTTALGAPLDSVADMTAAQLCGNDLPSHAVPLAHCYAGHQFGLFAGQLGDGASLTLGKAVPPSGRLSFEVQLKGTGATPFTRADAGTGRKTAYQLVRELLAAESLAALGVPTTRGLAVVVGGDANGVEDGECAVLLRTASAFFRFGSFEICLPRGHDVTGRWAPSAGDVSLLRRLADHVVEAHLPSVAAVPDDPEEDDEDFAAAPRFHALVLEVTKRTARLVASWQCLGAVHGMLNTDNLSVLGETLDHGSFEFMGRTDMSFSGRATDVGGRYCYGQQPGAARWACGRFAAALQPLHCEAPLQMAAEVEATFDAEFNRACDDTFRQKLGLKLARPSLVERLTRTMESSGADWTCTFRALTVSRSARQAHTEIMRWCVEAGGASSEIWHAWLHKYSSCLHEVCGPPPTKLCDDDHRTPLYTLECTYTHALSHTHLTNVCVAGRLWMGLRRPLVHMCSGQPDCRASRHTARQGSDRGTWKGLCRSASTAFRGVQTLRKICQRGRRVAGCTTLAADAAHRVIITRAHGRSGHAGAR